jgi:hypothetical protein
LNDAWGETGAKLKTLAIDGACTEGLRYTGSASLKTTPDMPPWVVTKLKNGDEDLVGVTLGVVYKSDGTLHEY